MVQGKPRARFGMQYVHSCWWPRSTRDRVTLNRATEYVRVWPVGLGKVVGIHCWQLAVHWLGHFSAWCKSDFAAEPERHLKGLGYPPPSRIPVHFSFSGLTFTLIFAHLS